MAKIDPIDRAAVIDTLRICLETKWFGSIEASMHYRDSIEFAMSCINAAPTLDVQPVRRSEWVDEIEPNAITASGREVHIFRCSACDFTWANKYAVLHYFRHCPNCGADMRKVRTDDV